MQSQPDAAPRPNSDSAASADRESTRQQPINTSSSISQQLQVFAFDPLNLRCCFRIETLGCQQLRSYDSSTAGMQHDSRQGSADLGERENPPVQALTKTARNAKRCSSLCSGSSFSIRETSLKASSSFFVFWTSCAQTFFFPGAFQARAATSFFVMIWQLPWLTLEITRDLVLSLRSAIFALWLQVRFPLDAMDKFLSRMSEQCSWVPWSQICLQAFQLISKF